MKLLTSSEHTEPVFAHLATSPKVNSINCIADSIHIMMALKVGKQGAVLWKLLEVILADKIIPLEHYSTFGIERVARGVMLETFHDLDFGLRMDSEDACKAGRLCAGVPLEEAGSFHGFKCIGGTGKISVGLMNCGICVEDTEALKCLMFGFHRAGLLTNNGHQAFFFIGKYREHHNDILAGLRIDAGQRTGA